MKVIEQKMIDAIRLGKSRNLGNTQVEFPFDNDKFSVYLFGNLIAKGSRLNKTVQVTHARHQTRTTKSRINALGAYVVQRNYVWYAVINGKKREFVPFKDTWDLNI